MLASDILGQRLSNQRLSTPTFEHPAQAVDWLGAVQAQDYPAAKWALGLRSKGVTDQGVEQAFMDGSILRTHVLRPTWHFVTPADIRWLLALTAPRVHAANAYYYRRTELDENVFQRSNAALAKALQGGRHLTRKELAAVLQDAGIPAEGLRLTYLVMRAELDGVICSGPKRGKQYTYALLDERVPHAGLFEHDEALSRLAARYFTSRGPATVQDFAWWSGLTVAEAREGIEMARPDLEEEIVEGRSYWLSSSTPVSVDRLLTAYLLPPFDEYMIAYQDRSPLLDPERAEIPENAIFNGVIAIAGLAVGNWKRRFSRGSVNVELKLFGPLTGAEKESVEAAAQRYAEFLGMPPELQWV